MRGNFLGLWYDISSQFEGADIHAWDKKFYRAVKNSPDKPAQNQVYAIAVMVACVIIARRRPRK